MCRISTILGAEKAIFTTAEVTRPEMAEMLLSKETGRGGGVGEVAVDTCFALEQCGRMGIIGPCYIVTGDADIVTLQHVLLLPAFMAGITFTFGERIMLESSHETFVVRAVRVMARGTRFRLEPRMSIKNSLIIRFVTYATQFDLSSHEPFRMRAVAHVASVFNDGMGILRLSVFFDITVTEETKFRRAL